MNKHDINIKNWPYAKWIAHRGGGKVAPENTLKGFQAGYQFGLCGVEFDVKLTKDNQSVVIHDDDLKRIAHIERKVKDLSLAEIIKIDAAVNYPQYQPAYVPSFKEVAKFCIKNNISTNVEIKPCEGRELETAEIVVRDALEYWQDSSIPPLFSSFSVDVLRMVKKLQPDSLRGLLIEDWLASDKEVIRHLQELDCVSLHVSQKDLTQDRVSRIIQAGYVVVVWTVNDIAKAREFFNWGVSSIITDLIDQVPFD